MVTFPNCKINLGLHVTAKRTDGFHDLESIFFPISLCDALEILPNPAGLPGNLTMSSSGLDLAGRPEDNLCWKAYHEVLKNFPELPATRLHLHKAIPAGAGLGGGSADAAFTLKLLNSEYGLGISTQDLVKYAERLGSDCPFFIHNVPCYVEGRGELIRPIELPMHGFAFLLVHPAIHIATGAAFAGIRPAQPPKPLRDIIGQPMDTWKSDLKNDFEKIIFPQHPAIAVIKEKLYAMGAVYASMSGSGSVVYGIFKKDEIIQVKKQAQLHWPSYSVFSTTSRVLANN